MSPEAETFKNVLKNLTLLVLKIIVIASGNKNNVDVN